MAAFSSVFSSLQKILDPPAQPTRLIVDHRVRLFAAVGAGAISAGVFLAGYYLTLSLLPSAFAYPTTEYPVSSWAHRMDLSQFLGSFLYPPLPSPLTWWIGFLALGGLLTSLGLVHSILLAWSLSKDSPLKGIVNGVALFLGLGFSLTLANGVHPAVMRNTFPDTGLFLIGWSSWATFQLFVLCILYGSLLSALYMRFTAKP